MSITIREALQLPDMVQTRLIAGESGLDNPIRWVTIVEVLEDTSRLQEGEFLITTGFGLESDAKKQADFIPALAKQKLSGVAIHTGFYLREIPSSFLEAANRYGLPLIEIPSGLNFSTITKAILQPIMNRQFQTLAYSQAIHEQIIKVALGGGGLQAIASELARLTSGHVTIQDAYGYEVVRRQGIDWDSTGKQMTHSTPIRAKEAYGSLTLTKQADFWQDLDQFALQHAATLCALEFVKEQAITETEWRMQGDFVEDLINGRLPWNHEVEMRCRMLGFSLTGKQMVATIRPEPFLELGDAAVWHRRLSLLIKRITEMHRVVFLLRERTKHLVLIIPDQPSSRRMLTQLVAQWNKLEPSSRLIIGLSQAKGQYTDWGKAVDEAEFALSVYPLMKSTDPNQPPDRSIIEYTQLGGYQFLFHYHRDPAGLRHLFAPLLEQIISYDKKHSQRLLETLSVYLEHNANGLQAASTLYIHRHTLKYRLQLIEEKTGASLSDAGHRWQLQLAVMAHRLYRLLHESAL
ncbi:PucR family transcriptional regulator [Brevibacillus ginsengisoli]|uniref:PucR family transcriptional regulator n=1 Tax=Brevibacillus ginsengisoli TaxID=363854 RepID=UPI003CEF6E22